MLKLKRAYRSIPAPNYGVKAAVQIAALEAPVLETNQETLPLVRPLSKNIDNGRKLILLFGFFSILLFAVLILRTYWFFEHSFQTLFYPFQLDYDEGFNLSAAWQWAGGTNIYKPNTPDHYIAAGYPPLFYLLGAAWLKIAGLSMAGGRWLSFIASLSVAGLIWLHSYRLILITSPEARKKWAVLFAGAASLCWFFLSPVYAWSTLYKQDMLALALGLGGLYFIDSQREEVSQKGKKEKFGSPGLVLGVLLLVLAVLSKQNQLITIPAAFIFLTFLSWKKAVFFSVLLCTSLGVFLAGLMIYSRGGFYDHVIRVQASAGWDFNIMFRLLLPLLRDHWAFVLFSVAFAFITLYRLIYRKQNTNFSGKSDVVPLMLIFLVCTGGELFTLGAYNSTYNHSIAFFPALLITAIAAFAWIVNRANLVERRLIEIAGLVLAGVFLAFQLFFYVQPASYFISNDLTNLSGNGKLRADSAIKQSPGEILSDDIYLQLSNNRPVKYDSLFHAGLQAARGEWDESKLLEDIGSRRFSLILLGHDSNRLTTNGTAALNANYKLAKLDELDQWMPLERPLQPEIKIKDCTFSSFSPSGQKPQFEMKGYSFGLKPPQSGETLVLSTYWDSFKAVPDRSYRLFVHLLNSEGMVVAQRDDTPGNGKKFVPTSTWKPLGTEIVDQNLPIPANLPAGVYRLAVGAYYVSPEGKDIEALSTVSSSNSNCNHNLLIFNEIRL